MQEICKYWIEKIWTISELNILSKILFEMYYFQEEKLVEYHNFANILIITYQFGFVAEVLSIVTLVKIQEK